MPRMEDSKVFIFGGGSHFSDMRRSPGFVFRLQEPDVTDRDTCLNLGAFVKCLFVF